MESRNGRYIKIDILDGYIRTPEVFRVISEKTGEPEGYWNPTGSSNPLSFLVQVGEGEGRERGEGAPPFLLVQFGLGGEGARGLPWQPLLFSTLGP